MKFHRRKNKIRKIEPEGEEWIPGPGSCRTILGVHQLLSQSRAVVKWTALSETLLSATVAQPRHVDIDEHAQQNTGITNNNKTTTTFTSLCDFLCCEKNESVVSFFVSFLLSRAIICVAPASNVLPLQHGRRCASDVTPETMIKLGFRLHTFGPDRMNEYVLLSLSSERFIVVKRRILKRMT